MKSKSAILAALIIAVAVGFYWARPLPLQPFTSKLAEESTPAIGKISQTPPPPAKSPTPLPSDNSTKPSNPDQQRLLERRAVLERAKATLQSYRDKRMAEGQSQKSASSLINGDAMWTIKKRDYAKLFSHWQIQPDHSQKVEDVLASLDKARRESRSARDKTKVLSPEDAALSKKLENAEAEARKALLGLLGPEKLDELDRWESSKVERKTVDRVAENLEDIQPLTEQQEFDLLKTLYQVRKRIIGDSGINLPANMMGQSYRDEIIGAMRPLLTEQQLGGLAKALEDEARRFER